MSDLPSGWEWSTVGEVADVVGGVQKSPKRRPVENAYPMLRVANVLAGRLDLREVNEVELFDGELDRLRLQSGDCLVVEGNGSVSQVGRAAMWRGEVADCVHQNHVLRARPRINPAYLMYWISSPLARREIERVASSTSGLHVLSGRKLRGVRVPVPPLAEQERIVAAIEENLSTFETARGLLDNGRRRIRPLERSILSISQSEGEEKSLGEILLNIDAGKSFMTAGRPAQRDEWGVVKVSAMTWGQFRDEENKAVPHGHLIDRRYEIKPGDLLLSRANTSEYVGATVLVEACRPHLLLSDKSMRLSPTPDVDRRWLRYALGSPHLRTQMSLVSTGTSDSMRNISQSKVNALRIRLPNADRQVELADQIGVAMSAAAHLARDVEVMGQRARSLRQAILSAAFAGRLVEQDPTDEPASVLLDRIRAEHLANGQKKKVSP